MINFLGSVKLIYSVYYDFEERGSFISCTKNVEHPQAFSFKNLYKRFVIIHKTSLSKYQVTANYLKDIT